MKKHEFIKRIAGLLCAVLVLTCLSISARAQDGGGRLVIYRVANFGTNLYLTVMIDGKQVARVSDGSHYDGNIPAGQHSIAVNVFPNRDLDNPFQMNLNVQAGKTYAFTAVWQGAGSLGLVKN